MEPAIVACLILAFIFWLIRLARIVIHFFKLLEIWAFYKNALGIPEVRIVIEMKYTRSVLISLKLQLCINLMPMVMVGFSILPSDRILLACETTWNCAIVLFGI